MIGLVLAVAVLIAGFVGAHYIDYSDILPHVVRIASVLLCIAIVGFSCISYVPTGYTGILVTFGRVEENILDAGISFHLPWQNVVKMDNREQRDAFQLEAFSKDIQNAPIS